MSTIVLTVIIAFVIFAAALSLLAISWLIKGKLSIKPGACGRAPKDSKECGSGACSLCDKDEKKKEK